MELFSFETILCMIVLHSVKKFTIVHHPFPIDISEMHQKCLYRVLTLMTKTYTEPLLKHESAPDGHSDTL